METYRYVFHISNELISYLSITLQNLKYWNFIIFFIL